MAGRVILFGSVQDRYENERLLTWGDLGMHVESAGRSWDFVERACEGAFDAAVVLKGSIAEHQQRLDAVAALRRNGFAGRVLYAGAFLTEKDDAVRAGADYVFDPAAQLVEKVIAAALWRPRVAVDHPWLRFMLAGAWVRVECYAVELPAAPDLVLATTSCHDDGAFWSALPRLLEGAGTRCVVVDDGGSEDACAAALASGLQPRAELERDGLASLQTLVGRVIREAWLARVGAA